MNFFNECPGEYWYHGLSKDVLNVTLLISLILLIFFQQIEHFEVPLVIIVALVFDSLEAVLLENEGNYLGLMLIQLINRCLKLFFQGF